jgi:hypothetical protein
MRCVAASFLAAWGRTRGSKSTLTLIALARLVSLVALLENENGSGLGWKAAIASETCQNEAVAVHTPPAAMLRKFATWVLSTGTSSAVGQVRD